MQQTSIDSYQAVLNDGTIAKSQKDLFAYLYNNGSKTGNEVNRHFGARHNRRLSELKKRGLVREAGTKVDPFTKMSCVLWEVTGEMPRAKVEKPEFGKWTRIKDSKPYHLQFVIGVVAENQWSDLDVNGQIIYVEDEDAFYMRIHGERIKVYLTHWMPQPDLPK